MAKCKVLFLLSFTILIALAACKNDVNIETGRYISEDGLSRVELKDDKQYSFNRHIATNYDPTGSYIFDGDKLILQDGDDEKVSFEFRISGSKLIFESGEHTESLIKKGTVFIYEDEMEERWDYRPMVSFRDSLYFDTGKVKEQLSEEWREIGKIEEVCSSTEPMRTGADHFIANHFTIGTKIYGKNQGLDTIYVAYDEKFIEYVLQDK